MDSIAELQLNGKDLKNSLEKRKAILQQLINKPRGVIRNSAALGDDAEPLLEQAGKLGLEGRRRLLPRQGAGLRWESRHWLYQSPRGFPNSLGICLLTLRFDGCESINAPWGKISRIDSIRIPSILTPCLKGYPSDAGRRVATGGGTLAQFSSGPIASRTTRRGEDAQKAWREGEMWFSKRV
jgi:hypothetical protein